MTEQRAIDNLISMKTEIEYETDDTKQMKRIKCETINAAISALKEIQEYRALGTVEELREAMEKQRAKKPIWKPYEREDENNPDPCCDWHCPTCGKLLTDRIPRNNKDFYFHCLNCGQKFDWS